MLIDKSFARLKDEILFVKLNNDGFDLGEQRREIEGSEIPEIIRIIQKYHSNLETQTSDEEIIHHSLVTIANKEKIAEQDYILVGERYKIDKPLATSYPVVPLSDICEINAENKNPALAFGDDEFIYIDISSVENGTGKIDFSNKIKGSDAPSRAKRAVKKEDILFSTVRPNLKAYGYVECEDCDCCVASTGFAVISVKNMVLSKYVYYMLYSEPVQAQLASMMGKGAYPSVNQKDVSQIQIPLPPLAVQEKVVTEIDRYQKIINGTKQITDNYLPSISTSASWPVVKLGMVFKLASGKGLPAKNRFDGPYNVYGGNGITGKHSEYFVDSPTLTIGRVGEYCGAAHITSSKCWITDNALMVTEYLTEVNPEYLETIINQIDLNQYAKVGGQPSISQHTVYNVPIPLPNIDVQNSIASQIRYEKSIIQQNKKLAKIFAQKITDIIDNVWGITK